MGASARLTPFGEVEIRTPYSERTRLLVDALKIEIPGRFRRWDAEDKVWRVMGAYREPAIALLLEHFPRATVPNDQPRRLRSTPARTEKPPPLPPLVVEASPEPDDPERDRLVASVRCPKCRQRHDQPIRVVAESSLTVAKRGAFPPELVAVCPHCRGLVVVAFYPAVAGVAVAS
jgi:hypothetical protein